MTSKKHNLLIDSNALKTAINYVNKHNYFLDEDNNLTEDVVIAGMIDEWDNESVLLPLQFKGLMVIPYVQDEKTTIPMFYTLASFEDPDPDNLKVIVLNIQDPEDLSTTSLIKTTTIH